MDSSCVLGDGDRQLTTMNYSSRRIFHNTPVSILLSVFVVLRFKVENSLKGRIGIWRSIVFNCIRFARCKGFHLFVLQNRGCGLLPITLLGLVTLNVLGFSCSGAVMYLHHIWNIVKSELLYGETFSTRPYIFWLHVVVVCVGAYAWWYCSFLLSLCGETKCQSTTDGGEIELSCTPSTAVCYEYSTQQPSKKEMESNKAINEPLEQALGFAYNSCFFYDSCGELLKMSSFRTQEKRRGGGVPLHSIKEEELGHGNRTNEKWNTTRESKNLTRTQNFASSSSPPTSRYPTSPSFEFLEHDIIHTSSSPTNIPIELLSKCRYESVSDHHNIDRNDNVADIHNGVSHGRTHRGSDVVFISTSSQVEKFNSVQHNHLVVKVHPANDINPIANHYVPKDDYGAIGCDLNNTEYLARNSYMENDTHSMNSVDKDKDGSPLCSNYSVPVVNTDLVTQEVNAILCLKGKTERGDSVLQGAPWDTRILSMLCSLSVKQLTEFLSSPSHYAHVPVFYSVIMKYSHQLSASVAADFLRLPVKLEQHNIKLTEALCRRLLSVPLKRRKLTAMQLALAAWSLARCNFTQSELYLRMMDSLSQEALNCLEEFQPLSIANMLWACGKLKYRNVRIIDGLARMAVAKLDQFNAQNIANVYWSLGNLECFDTILTPRLNDLSRKDDDLQVKNVMQHISLTLLQKLPSFNTQSLANFIWGSAKLQWAAVGVGAPYWNGSFLIHNAVAYATKKITYCKSQELSNMMWAVAKLRLHDAAPEVRRMANHAAHTLQMFNCQEVSNVYWAIGSLELRDTLLTPQCPCFNDRSSAPNASVEPCTNDVLGASRAHQYVAQPWNTTNSSYPSVCTTESLSTTESFTNLGKDTFRLLCDKPLLTNGKYKAVRCVNEHPRGSTVQGSQPLSLVNDQRSVVNHSEVHNILLRKMRLFTAQAIANLLWSFAKLQYRCSLVCEASYEIVERNVASFQAQNVANYMWAMAKLRLKNERVVVLLVNHAINIFSTFSAQELSNLYWSLGTMIVRRTPLTPSDDKRNSERQQNKNSVTYGDTVVKVLCGKLHLFKCQELANFLWACARLQWKHPQVLAQVTRVTLIVENRFKPQEIGNMLWSLAKLEYRCDALVKRLCTYVALGIRKFSAPNIVNVYWDLGSLAVYDSELTSKESSKESSKEFLYHLSRLILNFNQHEMHNFLWGCHRLGWQLPITLRTATQVWVTNQAMGH